MENDLKGNENWFELARVRVIGSRLYIAAPLTCKVVKITVKLLTRKQFNISRRFYNRSCLLLF